MGIGRARPSGSAAAGFEPARSLLQVSSDGEEVQQQLGLSGGTYHEIAVKPFYQMLISRLRPM